jgi:hypothetical protein
MKISLVLTAWLLALATTIGAHTPTPRIWEGVYTAAQAERGKSTFATACVRRHGADLAGTTVPALKGDRFITTWRGDTVSRLFEKIRDTMPPNFGTILDDGAKLDIVTYILQTNGYPAGERELSLGHELAGIQILREGEQAKVQNFSLVQAVGCLARDGNNAWLLRSSSEPVVTTENAPTADALAAAASKPLGNGSFVLLSTRPFDPDAHLGQKVEARGLIYQEPGDSLLTLTSLRSVGSCQR